MERTGPKRDDASIVRIGPPFTKTLERMTKNRSHATVIALSGRSSTEFSTGHNVASRSEVEATMEQAKRAGAEMVKAAQDTF